MQSFENTPLSPTKRLGVSLNIDTGYKGKQKEMSPPQTPKTENPRPSKGNITAANRALRVRTGLRETFLDDITPVDPSRNKENDPQRAAQPNRDSHDLSLSPRQVTRDSLVDHMLLSLDQFSFGQEPGGFGIQPTVEEERLYPAFGDEEPYQPTSNFAARNGRGIGHSYSYSSDYDNADDSSRYSGGQLSRGRRSNSSSNFQPGVGRLNSKRNEKGSNSSFATSRGAPPQIPPRGLHSRSGKGSKGSSANSFDLGYAQVTSSQRWAHGLAGRSSSFDYGSDRQSLNIQANPMARPIETNVATFDPYDYDAAPTPTVPVGPRRTRPNSPIVIPQPEPTPPVDPGPHKLERKRSTRSSKSAYKGKISGNAPSGGRYDYGLKDHNRELPPMPAFNRESAAPAPLVGYGKAKDAPPTSPGFGQPSKDKPGFFRRVFGSSRNNPAPEPPPSHGSTTSAETTERPGSKTHHIGNQLKSQHAAPPPREPPPVPKEHTHVLTKKPSSFFRRRKKSVSEAEPPAPLPIVPPLMLQPKEDPNAGKTVPSPISSLRKVMNPYLRTPARTPTDPFPSVLNVDIDREMNASPDPNDRGRRGFSPEYEPDKNATIRTVRPTDPEDEDMQPSGSAHEQYHSSPNAGADVLDGTRDDRDATFLQDSSDNDRDVPSGKENMPWPASPKLPPPSVARDMALVAEYERVHSKRSPTPAKIEAAKSSPVSDGPKSPTEPKSDLRQTTVITKDAEWVMVTPTNLQKQSEKENRLWLEPSSSEEDLALPNNNSNLKVSEVVERMSGSTDTVYKSATSLPIVQIDGAEESPPSQRRMMTAAEAIKSLDELIPDADVMVPADGDRERAKKVYDGNEDFIQREKAAAWMGEEGPARTRTLLAYMELYDFANLNILAALRLMCGRLVLKAESQQVDRILVAFSRRWCQCNPNHGFKGVGKFAFLPPITSLMEGRCCAYNLLFNIVAEHRSASCRYRPKDDSKSVHQEYHAYNPPQCCQFRARCF